MMMGFLYGVAFCLEFALGTLILAGLFRGVWQTMSTSKGLFWGLGWSAYLMSYASFMKALGTQSQAFDIFAATVQIIFHALVLTYVMIYSFNHWGEHENQ